MKTGHRNQKILILLLLVVLVAAAGCRQAETPPPAEPQEPAPAEEPAVPEEPEEEPLSPENGDLQQAEGRYVGFADTRSVEIELVNGDYDFMVFQLDETVQQQLETDEPDPGAEVTIRFRILEQGQPLITELTVK